MKTKWALLALVALATWPAAAQHVYYPEAWQRPKYFQLAYEVEKLTLPSFTILGHRVPELTVKSKIAANLATGKTYYLPSPKPELIRPGIDATWFKLRYLYYEWDVDDYGELDDAVKILYRTWFGDDAIHNHKVDIAMQAGVSININPARKIMISLYGRYQPTFTILADTKLRLDAYYGFSQGANYGLYVGFSAISFGVERMQATSRTLRPLLGDKAHEDTPGYLYEGDSDEPVVESAVGDVKLKSKGVNFYLSFRIFGLSNKDKKSLGSTKHLRNRDMPASTGGLHFKQHY